MAWNKRNILALLSDRRASSVLNPDAPDGFYYTKGQLAAMRGVVRLHLRQTLDERIDQSTKHLNQTGFSQAHARAGTKMARWMVDYRDEHGWQRPVNGWLMVGGRTKSDGNMVGGRWWKKADLCLHIARIYAGQLAEIANEMEAARATEEDPDLAYKERKIQDAIEEEAIKSAGAV